MLMHWQAGKARHSLLRSDGTGFHSVFLLINAAPQTATSSTLLFVCMLPALCPSRLLLPAALLDFTPALCT